MKRAISFPAAPQGARIREREREREKFLEGMESLTRECPSLTLNKQNRTGLGQPVLLGWSRTLFPLQTAPYSVMMSEVDNFETVAAFLTTWSKKKEKRKKGAAASVAPGRGQSPPCPEALCRQTGIWDLLGRTITDCACTCQDAFAAAAAPHLSRLPGCESAGCSQGKNCKCEPLHRWRSAVLARRVMFGVTRVPSDATLR